MSRRSTTLGSFAAKGLTPLLDTLFILLLALLALSDTKQSTVNELVRISLPSVEPAADAPAAPRPRITIAIDAESRVTIPDTGEVVASRAVLDRALAVFLGESAPEEFVVDVQADREARHGIAVELLQHLRLRGFANVNLLATGSGAPGDPFGR